MEAIKVQLAEAQKRRSEIEEELESITARLNAPGMPGVKGSLLDKEVTTGPRGGRSPNDQWRSTDGRVQGRPRQVAMMTASQTLVASEVQPHANRHPMCDRGSRELTLTWLPSGGSAIASHA